MEWRSERPAKRWVTHAGHGFEGWGTTVAGPHRTSRPGFWERVGGSWPLGGFRALSDSREKADARPIILDGSKGEGGGQILRTALTLSLLTGRPFRLKKVRANREKPGLRPQHRTAVLAAAELGHAAVTGAEVGSRELTFRPGAYEARDLGLDIGTAGSTCLVLQTLHLPLALRANAPVRVTLTGGTFNMKAPSYPFLQNTWRGHLVAANAPVALAMPGAGFYPRGGGMLDAWIEPAKLRPLTLTDRGRLLRIRGEAGVARLGQDIVKRMRTRALDRLAKAGLPADVEITIDLVEWDANSPGAAIWLAAEHEAKGVAPATFVGLGERGKPSEAVADEAIDELLAYLAVPGGAVDPHSADQLLLPLALAEGRSEFTTTEVTEHLRTNVQTVRAFLDREITLIEPEPGSDEPGRVIVA